MKAMKIDCFRLLKQSFAMTGVKIIKAAKLITAFIVFLKVLIAKQLIAF